ncbi:hypothetical protein H0H87_011112, partial [Tephrocybe sp. NHM501043]
MSSSSSVSTLRDTLLDALSHLPGTREFHLHVLVTAPRKTASLFPFAHPRPRVYVQDILVLLSEQAAADEGGSGGPRKLVAALEASVYSVAATASAILYVSKLDSTGHAARPSPTYTLARTLLRFYADPGTRPVDARSLWIHTFARAQGQYLFPNSAEYEGKRPLSDVRLCAWWKRVFADVERDVRAAATTTGLYYVLPGYSEIDAVYALRTAGASRGDEAWTYGHPYSQTDIPLPCPGDGSGERNLGHLIPSFEDDPKSRFMDEMAYTTEGEIQSPQRKRQRTSTSSSQTHGESSSQTQGPLGELRKVLADEFWERMSFRQECVAGAVTGFFTLGITSDSGSGWRETPGAGQVPAQLNKRVLTTLTTGTEYSTEERTIRGTEIVEGAIRGLCEGIATVEYGEDVYGRSLPSFAQTFSGAHVPVSTSLRLPPLDTQRDKKRACPGLVHIKEEHDDDTSSGAPPPSSVRPPSKRRRVTISGAPHPLNTDVASPPADPASPTPISPVVMGFTVTRDNPTAIEKVKNMISVKQKQKALIEQRRGSLAGLDPVPAPRRPTRQP